MGILQTVDRSTLHRVWVQNRCPRTSGQSRVQTALKTFQDLDLCSKTVIMDVVGYIGKQQSRRKQALWSWSDLIWWYRALAFPQNVQFLFCTDFCFCFIMISSVDVTDPTLYIQIRCLVHLIWCKCLDKHSCFWSHGACTVPFYDRWHCTVCSRLLWKVKSAVF